MTPAATPCPDSQRLHQLLRGCILPPESDALFHHLETCDRCEEAAAAFHADDPLHDALRCHDADDGADTPSVMELVESLRRQGPPRMAPTRPAHEDVVGDDCDLLDFLAPAQLPDELGRLGPYRVLKVLGAGGMGVVFHGEDPVLRRAVALKAMRPRLAAGASARSRFLREARAAAALHHDHVVPIYHVGEEGGVPFLAMPLLGGESLEDRLEREGALPPAEVCRIGREIALGLAAAHAVGLVHRDIKPGNVWLESREERSPMPDSARVKILDFGLARSAAEAGLTQEGAIVGTPAFMAPEQATGGAVDARSDLFSLGCILYRMATGELPFQGTNAVATLLAVCGNEPRPPREVRPDLPPALCDLILCLLAKKPEARPPSARVVAESLGAIECGPPPSRSRFAPRAGLAAAGVVLLGAIGGAAFLCRPAERPTPADTAKPAAPAEPPPAPPAPVAAPQPPPVVAAPEPPPPPDDKWQVVAQLDGPHFVPGRSMYDFRAVAFRLPYLYAINVKSFTSGDLVVFKLPDQPPGPGASLRLIEDCGVVEDAGDGGDLCVIGDVLLCTHLGGLNVFSLKDPARPSLVKRVGPAARPRRSESIIRLGALACLVGESGNISPASYLSVFDLSDPAEPRPISLNLINVRAWCGCGAGDHRLYLGTINQFDGERNGVAVYDLTDPETPREEDFVETNLPFHVFADGSGKRLLAVAEGRLQPLSLADPARPALLGPAVLLDGAGGTAGRSAAFVEFGGRERLICLGHVFAWDDNGCRQISPFQCWNVGSGLPHHGAGQDGYVALPLDRNIVVLWSAAFAGKQ